MLNSIDDNETTKRAYLKTMLFKNSESKTEKFLLKNKMSPTNFHNNNVLSFDDIIFIVYKRVGDRFDIKMTRRKWPS